jgi:hypothetical protein
MQPELVCRICIETVETQDVFSPCACSGSIARVHLECLSQWISTRSKDQIPQAADLICELCKSPYQINLERHSRIDLQKLTGTWLMIYLLPLSFLVSISVFILTAGLSVNWKLYMMLGVILWSCMTILLLLLRALVSVSWRIKPKTISEATRDLSSRRPCSQEQGHVDSIP